MTVGMQVLLVLGLSLWLACGLFYAGCVYAFFQDEFPRTAKEQRTNDSLIAVLGIVLGPIIGVSSWITLGSPCKHGWRLPFTRPGR